MRYVKAEALAMRAPRLLLCVLLSLAVACTREAPAPDEGSSRGGEADAGDVSATDLGPLDADQTRSDAASASDGGLDAGAADAGPVEEELPDRSHELYDRGRMLQVNVQLDEEDWEALRYQDRWMGDIIRPGCQDEPFPSPFTWFRARVSVDGEIFHDVGVRKKGFFGSLSNTKPSLKIRFDKFVEGQTMLGVKRLTLNNSRQDPSYMRQCLAYDMFARAGIPASRCNFAKVVVNGRNLGVFTNIEAIKKPFLRRHFEDEDGYLYEGTLSDFRPGWTGSFDQKTDEETPYTAPIDALVEAAALPDEELIPALEELLDFEQFLNFWATEIMVSHWDGYSGNTNNFYIYDDPTSGRVHFIPWGTDGTFIQPRKLFEGQPAPRSINAAGVLARRLYLHPEGQERYLARLQELLDMHWDVGAMHEDIDEMEAFVEASVPRAQKRDFSFSVSALRSFVRNHVERIREEIVEGPEEWNTPLRGVVCGRELGRAEGRFSTTFGSWPTDNTFETGSGSMEVVFDGDRLPFRAVGGAIGQDEEDPRKMLMLIPMLLQHEALVFLRFFLEPDSIRSGHVIDVTDFGVRGALFYLDLESGEITQMATCSSGRIRFEEASTVPGAPVSAAVEVDLWGG